MRQYVLTDAEMKALIEGLEFEKLRLKDMAPPAANITIDDIHRRMHHHVVRWAQDVAGYRQ